jgi:hypothetical protein
MWQRPGVVSLGRAQLLAGLLLALTLLPAAVEAQQDCGRLPFCSACVARRIGTVTRMFCTACTTGYTPSRDQRICVCSAGFYWDSFQGTCEPCGIGSW